MYYSRVDVDVYVYNVKYVWYGLVVYGFVNTYDSLIVNVEFMGMDVDVSRILMYVCVIVHVCVILLM